MKQNIFKIEISKISLSIAFLAFVNTSAMGNEPNTAALIEGVKQARNQLFRTNFNSLDANNSKSNNADVAKLNEKMAVIKGRPARGRKAKAEEAIKQEPNTAAAEPNVFAGRHDFDANAINNLMQSTKDPNTVKEPLEIAEMLYATGHNQEAAVFYEIAITRKTSMGRDLNDDDRAWMLLQIANCRKNDLNAAALSLNELLRKYPNSIWSQAAAAQRDLINWYRQERPGQMRGVQK
jgi:hypothetical protein